MVTERPRAFSRAPSEAEASPFPREESTPPVTKMNLVFMNEPFYGKLMGNLNNKRTFLPLSSAERHPDDALRSCPLYLIAPGKESTKSCLPKIFPKACPSAPPWRKQERTSSFSGELSALRGEEVPHASLRGGVRGKDILSDREDASSRRGLIPDFAASVNLFSYAGPGFSRKEGARKGFLHGKQNVGRDREGKLVHAHERTA